MEKITVTEKATYHHMPEGGPSLLGLSLRDALTALRGTDFGNIGGTNGIELSDKTYIEVVNRPAEGGGEIMNSQRIRRYEHTTDGEKTIRFYEI